MTWTRQQRHKAKAKRRPALGTGRTPNPDEIIKDPDWKPSKIKGQWGGAFG
jgi:hypothetical protein